MEPKNPSDENRQLRARVAALESKVDLLETEFMYLNRILVDCGFPGGIAMLKSTVEEVLEDYSDESYQKVRRQKEEDK